MDLHELWQAALDDAGFDSNAALLFVLPGARSKTGDSAQSWVRGTAIYGSDDRETLGERLDEANSAHGRAACRVAIWIDRSVEGIAALLRHELEHCRQFDVHGVGLQRLHDDAVSVLAGPAAGLPRSNLLYNAIPMEVDANAAAAVFVRSIFGDARIDSLLANGDEHAALFRSREGPQPISSLRTRMETFISADGPILAEDFARRTPPVVEPSDP